MEKIEIVSSNDLISLLQKAISDVNYFENKNLIIDPSCKELVIHIKGDKFNASITTGLMKGLLALQQALYDTYLLSIYGGKTRKLTSDEKKGLELSVLVEAGSSTLTVVFDKIIDAITERIKQMNSKEIIATVAIVSVVIMAGVVINKNIDAASEIKKLEIEQQGISDTQKNTNEIIKTVLEAQNTFFRSISHQDFTNLSISGEDFTRNEIENIVKVERTKKPITTMIYNDKYLITDIHFKDDAIYLDVHGISNGQVIKYVNIFKDKISEDDYQWFKDSTNRQPIEMKITTTEKDSEIIAAALVSFSK